MCCLLEIVGQELQGSSKSGGDGSEDDCYHDEGAS